MRTLVPVFALTLLLLPASSWAEESFAIKAAKYAQSKFGANGPGNPAYNTFRENAISSYQSYGSSSQFRPPGSITTTDQLKAKVNEYAGVCRQIKSRASLCCSEGGSTSCQISRSASAAHARVVQRTVQTANGRVVPQASTNQSAAETEGLSNDAAVTGAGVAGACYGHSEYCATKCVEARSKLAKLISSCAGSGCSQHDLEPLDNEINGCKEMQGRVEPLAGGVNELLGTAQEAGAIKEQTEQQGMQPQSAGSGMGGMNPLGMLGPMMQALGGQKDQQGQGQQQYPQQQFMPQQAMGIDQTDCNVNPNMAGCPSSGLKNVYAPRGETSLEGPSSDAGSFNVGSADMNPQNSETGMSNGFDSKPATFNTIPNGGGSMPGGGGGGAASLGGGSGGGGAASPGSKADILHGERSGGGYASMAEGMNLQSGDGGGGYNYSGSGGSGYEGMDLSQYLPGGRHDPGRRLAGFGGGGVNSQILSRDVNIWNRISDRIRNRCNQGLLRDCMP